jgi:hypothetical protein
METQFKRGTAKLAGLESQDYKDFKLEEFQKALSIVRDRIKSDPDLMRGYIANIAMPFLDCEHHYRKKTGKRYLNQKDKHTIANEAAENFMNLWLK